MIITEQRLMENLILEVSELVGRISTFPEKWKVGLLTPKYQNKGDTHASIKITDMCAFCQVQGK